MDDLDQIVKKNSFPGWDFKKLQNAKIMWRVATLKMVEYKIVFISYGCFQSQHIFPIVTIDIS